MFSYQTTISTFIFFIFTLLLNIGSAVGGFVGREQQVVLKPLQFDHNELYVPNPDHPVPLTVPFIPDESIHHYEKQVNGSGNGYYRRSSCPAVNIMANRGYVNRSGRNITSDDIARAAREIFNFGDDNVRGFLPLIKKKNTTYPLLLLLLLFHYLADCNTPSKKKKKKDPYSSQAQL